MSFGKNGYLCNQILQTTKTGRDEHEESDDAGGGSADVSGRG